MLRNFYVRDYVLIDEIKAEFGKGLNIITGETGAGKSILVDAMGLLLGERASSEIVRKGASKAIIEGIFEMGANRNIADFLNDNGIESLEELILRREIPVKGNNRCFINDTPVTLTFLKELGNLLVDLHGQHEHQSLLKTETHIDFLDQYAELTETLEEYKLQFGNLQKNIHEVKDLLKRENDIREKREFYSFQIGEIDNINPQPDEEDLITSELKILENSEKLLELTNEVYQSAYDSDDAIYDQLVKIRNTINELAKIDKAFSEISEECDNALNLIKDISEFFRDYNSRISLEPSRLENLRTRLASLQLLKKKYGGSINSVLEYRSKIGNEFELADSFSEKIQEMNKQIEVLRNSCGAAAGKLSAKRHKVSHKIKEEVKAHLNNLGITSADFDVKIMDKAAKEDSSDYVVSKGLKYHSAEKGFNEVEFYISTNTGEDVKPLAKVASGGEVSRIMLALKSALAKSEKLPLLIFDEIDTGISGRIAQKVGTALKSLSEFHQVIAITHLPQIAGQADIHFAIEKTDLGDRVVSSLRILNQDERIREIAKLMSGEKITEATLSGAKELMGF